ncbi:MAG: tetratricopeptide repeat protein [Acidobacteriaceae bacterium]|nr:tetratricopeptide repeat protein [Acidobacteriaceae bacterium]
MILALLFLIATAEAISPEGARHMQAGVDAHKQGHFDIAISEFRKATETDPTFAQAFLNLGEEYANTGDYRAAIPALKRAVELSPDLDEAHRQLGFVLLTEGFPGEAIPHLERVHALGPLGIAQTETGQYQDAIGNLSTALADKPNDQDLLYYLGRAAGLLSKHAIDTLVTEYPDSARSHQAMAENYFVLRQIPQAENELQQALRERPNMPGLHLELGLVYAKAEDWPKAETEFRAETLLRPGNAEASYRLGSALLQQGKAKEARVELERADNLQPDMPETLYSLGKAASSEGDTAAAEKAWLRVTELEHDTSLAAQAHFGLAGIYRKQGNAEKASAEMAQFRKLQKTGDTKSADDSAPGQR